MDDRKKCLVEGDLYTAITAFHDCNDKEKREGLIRKYTLMFCEKYDIDVIEALDLVTKMINHRRQNSDFKYEYYKDLRKIVLDQDTNAANKTNSKDKPENPEDNGR